MPDASPDTLAGDAGAARSDADLPTPLTPMLGRDQAVAQVLTLLDRAETRLLTLTGPGGVGKTRLAIEVAYRVHHDFADGVGFVALAPIRDSSLIAPAIANGLGVPERTDQTEMDMLITALSERHLLLVLDNFEHLLDVSPAWLTELLGACPRLKVLVTSRTALSVGGEQRFVVPPLPVPGAARTTGWSSEPAVMLFGQRASAIDPGFTMNESNVDTIAAVCARLDGLPLAIELAAARIGVLTPEQILSRLTERFRLLTGGQRDAPARLRSMRDAIAWSYDLLSVDEQRFFRHLSVFIGGFTLEAAEAVCGTSDHPGMDALTGVSTLMDHSLVQRGDSVAGGPRFVMLETIREYAAERLADSDDETPLRDRHADWYLSLVSQHADVLAVPGPAYLEAIDRIEADFSNLRVALAWLDAAGRHDDLARLVNGLGWYWQTTVREGEALPWYKRVITALDPASPVYLDTLLLAGSLAYRLGSSQVSPLLVEGLTLARSQGDRRREAFALAYLGISTSERGDYDEAEAMLRDARQGFSSTDETEWMWWMEYQLGIAALGRGDLDAAVRILDTVKLAAEHRQNQYMACSSADYLLMVACVQNNVDEALALSRYLDARLVRVELLYHHPVLLSTRAMLATARGRPIVAARLFGAASQGAIRAMLPERAIYEHAAAATRRHLGEDLWKQEWDNGRRARVPDLADEIDRLMSNDATPVEPGLSPQLIRDTLTRRELDVLRLLADGLTNAQIADRLYVSQRTAATHVRHIFDKLDVSSRAAAVAWAIRSGLA